MSPKDKRLPVRLPNRQVRANPSGSLAPADPGPRVTTGARPRKAR